MIFLLASLFSTGGVITTIPDLLYLYGNYGAIAYVSMSLSTSSLFFMVSVIVCIAWNAFRSPLKYVCCQNVLTILSKVEWYV